MENTRDEKRKTKQKKEDKGKIAIAGRVGRDGKIA